MGLTLGGSFGDSKTDTNTSGESYDDTVANAVSNSTQSRTQGKSLSDILSSSRVISGGDISTFDSGQTTTSSGGGSSTQTQISSSSLDAILQRLMGGFGGFTSIASGSKKAGVYGSTTEAQQSADFLSKIIGEVARIMSPTITKELDRTVTQGSRNTNQKTSDKKDVASQTNISNETLTDLVSNTGSNNQTNTSKRRQFGTVSGSGSDSKIGIGVGGGSGSPGVGIDLSGLGGLFSSDNTNSDKTNGVGVDNPSGTGDVAPSSGSGSTAGSDSGSSVGVNFEFGSEDPPKKRPHTSTATTSPGNSGFGDF